MLIDANCLRVFVIAKTEIWSLKYDFRERRDITIENFGSNRQQSEN